MEGSYFPLQHKEFAHSDHPHLHHHHHQHPHLHQHRQHHQHRLATPHPPAELAPMSPEIVRGSHSCFFPFQSDKGSLYLKGLPRDPALCVVHNMVVMVLVITFHYLLVVTVMVGTRRKRHHRHHCATFVCFLFRSVSLVWKLLVALSFDQCTYIRTVMLANQSVLSHRVSLTHHFQVKILLFSS